MIKSNPANIFPLMRAIGNIFELYAKTPTPKRHLTKIIQAEIDHQTEYVVIMKCSFVTKEDAENFVKLDSVLDNALTKLQAEVKV